MVNVMLFCGKYANTMVNIFNTVRYSCRMNFSFSIFFFKKTKTKKSKCTHHSFLLTDRPIYLETYFKLFWSVSNIYFLGITYYCVA